MEITFVITLVDDEREPYVAREIKFLNDGGDVWRESLLEGHSASIYSAIAKLCFMNLELEGRKDEIFILFKHYAQLYLKSAEQAIVDAKREMEEWARRRAQRGGWNVRKAQE